MTIESIAPYAGQIIGWVALIGFLCYVLSRHFRRSSTLPPPPPPPPPVAGATAPGAVPGTTTTPTPATATAGATAVAGTPRPPITWRERSAEWMQKNWLRIAGYGTGLLAGFYVVYRLNVLWQAACNKDKDAKFLGGTCTQRDGFERFVETEWLLAAAIAVAGILFAWRFWIRDGKQVAVVAVPAPPPPVTPPKKKGGRPGVGASAVLGAVIAGAIIAVILMLAWKNPLIHSIVVIPIPYIIYGLLLVAVFAIPRIGPLSAVSIGVLILVAVGKEFLPLQEQSVLWWGQLHLPKDAITISALMWEPLSFLSFFTLMFVLTKVISERRTRAIWLMAAIAVSYTMFFTLAVSTWK